MEGFGSGGRHQAAFSHGRETLQDHVDNVKYHLERSDLLKKTVDGAKDLSSKVMQSMNE